VSRAMAVLLAAAGAAFSLIVPLDHGPAFIVGMITTAAVVGGGAYAASAPSKKLYRNLTLCLFRLLELVVLFRGV
jgi:hypothetical protein